MFNEDIKRMDCRNCSLLSKGNQKPVNRRMNFQYRVKWLALFLFLLVFQVHYVFAANNPNAGSGDTCTIDIHKTYQTIDNFGASDCWTIQYVGRWPDKKRNAIADLLFSEEVDSTGKPKGIGLSLWRFNIGAGSAAQGDDSGIPDIWRRAECFQNPDGSYDWTRQEGQQWFLKAAQKRGVSQFLGFAISAPVQMTQNGLAMNKGRNETFNLKPGKYDDYAQFLADVVKGIQQHDGVKLNYLAPFNEPEWDWTGSGQEGTPALNSEIAREVRALDKNLSSAGLDTRIVITESGQLDYLYKTGTNKPGRDGQIEDFFSPSSPDYVGNLKHMPAMIAGHAYWTVNPVNEMIGKREKLHQTLEQYGLKYWQTEVCLMENIPGIGGGHGRDLTMNTALFFARLIHTDMVVSNASAWHWWLGVSNSDYKDGLIFVFPDKSRLDGTFTDSKLLWALGNYSRFVHPGAVRVNISSPALNLENPRGLMISAYHLQKDKQVVAVAVNYGGDDKNFILKIPGIRASNVISYLTSGQDGKNLSPENLGPDPGVLRVPSRSVVTFVIHY